MFEILLPSKKVIFVFVARCALPFESDSAPSEMVFHRFLRKYVFFGGGQSAIDDKKGYFAFFRTLNLPEVEYPEVNVKISTP